MLTNPTIDMLRELGLSGMASAYHELEAQPEARQLEHGEWLTILLERETTTRRQKRFEARARAAKLRHDAQIENIDFRAARGLDRNLFLRLAGCDWIRHHHSLLLIGPAGVGKSWLAHSSFCSSSSAPTGLTIALSLGTMPTATTALNCALTEIRQQLVLERSTLIDETPLRNK